MLHQECDGCAFWTPDERNGIFYAHAGSRLFVNGQDGVAWFDTGLIRRRTRNRGDNGDDIVFYADGGADAIELALKTTGGGLKFVGGKVSGIRVMKRGN